MIPIAASIVGVLAFVVAALGLALMVAGIVLLILAAAQKDGPDGDPNYNRAKYGPEDCKPADDREGE